MSAAALRKPKFAQGVDERPDGEFVPLRRAARLLGRNEASLRRECGKLAGTGMARQVRSASGQTSWHIHRSYDPRLVTASATNEPSDDATTRVILSATKAQRDTATAKMRVLLAYRELASSGKTVADHIDLFISEQRGATGLTRLSYRQLREWSRNAPPSDQRNQMLAFFIDRRGGNQRAGGAGHCSPEAWEAFEAVFLTEQQWFIAKAWRHVEALAKRHGWSWPGKRHVERLVSQRIDPSRLCMAREGVDVWRQKFGLKLEQHPEAYAAGELWVGDHSDLDFFAKVMRGGKWRAVRLKLTAWQDWRTRVIAGWYISEHGNSDTIRYALHHGMMRLSHVPTRVWIDNGKDFASEATTGITKAQRRKLIAEGKDWREHFTEENGGLLAMLNIDTHFARPYNHDGKARLERFFGTMHGEFDKEFASYCGHKPGAVPKHNVPVEKLPTIDSVRQRFAEFMQWYHDRVDHDIADLRDDEQRKLSPAEAWRTWLTTRTIMPAPEAMALLLKRWAHPKAVTQLGIGLDFGTGRRVYYGAGLPDLAGLQGRKGARLHVTYDPENVSEIYVYDPAFRFICIAPINDLYGGVDAISRAALREGINRQRDHEKAVRSTALNGHLSIMSRAEAGREAQRDIDEDRRKARQREGIAPDTEPNSMRLVRTVVDEELTAVQKAEFRRAAGAESMSGDEQFELPILEPERRNEEEDEGLTFNICDALEGETQRNDADFDIWEGLTQ